MPGEALARIRGIPDIPSITEINVRPIAGTNQDVAFKVLVGMSGQKILDVQPDVEGKNLDGKIYQWFKLQFDGGAIGWVRDDLLEVQGGLSTFGYPDLSELTFAFALTRGTATSTSPAEPTQDASPSGEDSAANQPIQTTTSTAIGQAPQVGTAWQAPGPTTVPIQAPTLASGNFPDAFADTERVRKAAFNMASAFEGGFGAINTYDAGIISYGFLQFTLAAGSLGTVLQNYTNRSQSDTAKGIRGYLERVINRDSLLKNDQNFLGLLRAAANEQEMIDAQGEIGEQGYWKAVVDGYIVQRQLKYPLTWALLFDMGVNFGVNHGFVRLAERDLGVAPRSKPADSGMPEEQLITYVAQLRKRSHDRQAERDNLPGLRKRGDFWMNLVTIGDWYLQGNSAGNVYPNGCAIQALNP
ncbi:MAG: chitosanase [Anaerolineae bacterium]|nr:chitosanase [Anaerolineae bacterium]MDQ7037489.1 chitosanase [Anaerolineae bacterium]